MTAKQWLQASTHAHKRLRSYHRYINSDERADLVHEAVTRLLEQNYPLQQLDTASISNLLTRIASRLAIDSWRSSRTQNLNPTLTTKKPTISDDPDDDTLTEHFNFEFPWLNMDLNEAITSLTPDTRYVFVLHFEGFSFAEIGEKLRISTACAQKRYERGTAQMRRRLASYAN